MPNNLRSLRTARDWSQEQAAGAMGTTRNQYVKLERGERRLSDVWIERAAAAFGTDAAEVVQGSEVPIVGQVGPEGEVTWSDGEPIRLGRYGLRIGTSAIGELVRGGVLVFRHERRPPVASDHDRPVLLCMREGSMRVGRLVWTGREGLVHLIRDHGAPVLDTLAAWVSPVLLVDWQIPRCPESRNSGGR